MKKNKKESQAGFTFIETLAVLAVGAILTAGAGAAATKLISYGRTCSAKSQIESFKAALASYYIDCGTYPSDSQGLNALFTKPDMYPVPALWNGPYLDKEIPVDPWGHPYEYYSRGGGLMPSEAPEALPFVLICRGSDGLAGGKGEAQDIFSWK